MASTGPPGPPQHHRVNDQGLAGLRLPPRHHRPVPASNRGSPADPRAKTSTLTPLLACLIWRDESGHMRGSPIGEPRHPATQAVSRLNLRDAPIWSRSTTSSAKRRGRNTVTVSFLSLFTAKTKQVTGEKELRGKTTAALHRNGGRRR
nr:hypothetical protein Iba_chr10fCG3660 [Ipomoea batatas]